MDCVAYDHTDDGLPYIIETDICKPLHGQRHIDSLCLSVYSILGFVRIFVYTGYCRVMASSENGMDLLKLQADICKAFADPKRLFIIKELAQGERSVGELAEKLGVRSANVSQHLAILRDRGIVEARREGTTLFYNLANPRIADACQLVQQILLDQIRKTGALTSGL